MNHQYTFKVHFQHSRYIFGYFRFLRLLLDQPATSAELIKTLGFKRRETIDEWMKRLKDKRVAEKPTVFGKWRLKGEFAEFLRKKLNQPD